ncbi:MAG: hypothetical protein HZC41_01665 [Chloroflexi bacterium]|nr:hypothetical protein [Chloroflexota bacterium]
MKRGFARLSILLAVGLLVIFTGAWTAAAQQPSQPAVQASCPHVLRAGIPFAWLRFEPSSFAGFSITLRSGETVQPNDPPALRWDGSQWWIYVWPNAVPGNHGYFWVELSSLEPRCQTTPPPSGMANWKPGDVVRVRQSVPFVWFRGAPAPGNPPILTVLPGAQLVIIQGGVSDNYNQWWWQMRDLRTNVTGWVEQNTVEPVSNVPGPVMPSNWQIGDVVRIKPSVPFAWLRFSPSSTAGFSYAARPGDQLEIWQPSQSDGVQNWWGVGVASTRLLGWVEESSLEFVRRGR